MSEGNVLEGRWMREEEKREGNVFVGGGMMSGGVADLVACSSTD